jgi:hypothetical protein
MLTVFRFDPLHLGEREIFDSAVTSGRSVDRGIVEHDDVAVAGEAKVDLDEVYAEFDGFFDRAERVLQHMAGSAAVTYAKGFAHLDVNLTELSCHVELL